MSDWNQDPLLQRSRAAWNRESREGSEWSRPVDADTVARARRGDWQVVLTPRRAVPRDWFGALDGADVLCLASGGGQQAAILAAAGAQVTSFDLADEQLAKDAAVAARDGLPLRCEQGDMRDLGRFAETRFDLVFHPISNVFVPDPTPVWRECFRVLRPGGRLLAGFCQPALFLFDHDAALAGSPLTVQFPLPYAEPESLPPTARQAFEASGRAAEFSHSLEAQIGGQLAVGFQLLGLYEDQWDDRATPLNRYLPLAIATLARKPAD